METLFNVKLKSDLDSMFSKKWPKLRKLKFNYFNEKVQYKAHHTYFCKIVANKSIVNSNEITSKF